MIPYLGMVNDLIEESDDTLENRKTFYLNINENIIGGKVDGLEALKQSIYFMLNTEADQYIIYPYTYGITTLDLFGKPVYYVMAVLPDRIKETLLSDSRITDVSDFEFKVDKNKLTTSFVVHTVYGDTKEEVVVNY